MALTKEQKKLRRKITGQAVAALRQELHLSQSVLARMMGEKIEVGTISRWERGQAAPHPSSRAKLAQIAQKNGLRSITAAFRDPERNWRGQIPKESQFLQELITSLELCAMNPGVLQSGHHEKGGNKVLGTAARLVRRRLVEYSSSCEELVLPEEAHRELWFTILEGSGRRSKRKRHGKETR